MQDITPDFDSEKEEKGMDKYFILLKTNPTRNNAVRQKLRKLQRRPSKGVRLYYTMNCFGTWDLALWFEAEKHDYVIDFINKKVCSIPGIIETHLVSTSPIKEYIHWK